MMRRSELPHRTGQAVPGRAAVGRLPDGGAGGPAVGAIHEENVVEHAAAAEDLPAAGFGERISVRRIGRGYDRDRHDRARLW